MQVDCAYCGLQLTRPPSRANASGNNYCNQACWSKHCQENDRQQCMVCGIMFSRTKTHRERRQGAYCSQRCAGDGKRTATETVCAFCGKTFSVTPYRESRKRGKFCSRSCSAQGRRHEKRSAKHKGWWAREVKKRDGCTCRQCGSRKRPQAHHLLFRSERPDESEALGNGVCLCYTCHRAIHYRKAHAQLAMVFL